MREQRLRKATNGRPEASGDAPAELAAHISHHFERFPGCRLLAGELPGGQRRQPSKTQKLLLNASSPALSKDLSGLQKVSQLNFAFCSSFSLPSTALHQRNFVGLLSSFSEAFVGWSSGKDFTISRELLGSQPLLRLRPNSGPGSDSSVKGPNTPRKPLRKF